MVQIQQDHFDIAAIAESGQCFRINKTAESTWTAIAGDRLLTIEQRADGSHVFLCPEEEHKKFWHEYFDLATDYSLFLNIIPSSDQYLSRAARQSGGIRILRQDPWEALISFILSQRKNIPAIKKSIEMLCRRYGRLISGGTYAFPAPEALAGASEEELLACSLGYRAKYVSYAANAVANKYVSLTSMAEMDDISLKKALTQLYGVGDKVAECVMLFGFHRMAAFPRDVWINRIIAAEYEDAFPTQRYSGFAGVIQQYMFYYARNLH